MGRFINTGLEDDLAPLDDAIAAQNKMDSTDPKDVVEVANYKEELAKLRAQNAEGGEDGGDGTGSDDSGATSGSTDDTGNTDTDPGANPDENEDDAGAKSEDSDSIAPATDAEKTEPSDENLSAANEAISTMTAIGKIHGIMESKLKVGGISAEAATMGGKMASLLAERLGLEYRPTTPAVEAFESISTRIVATKQAMEGLSEFLSELWQAIVNFFKKIWRWVADFLFTRRKGVAAAQGRLDAVKRIETQLANKKLNDERVERFSKECFRQRAAVLLIKKREGDYRDVVESIDTIKTIVTDVFRGLTTGVPERFRQTLTGMKSNDLNDWKPFVIQDTDIENMHLTRNEVLTASLGNNASVALQSEALPGNRRIMAIVLRKGQLPLPDYYKGKHRCELSRDSTLGDMGREVKVCMDVKMVKKITEGVADLFKLHEDLSNFMKNKLEEMISAFGKKAEAELARVKTGSPSANTKVLAEIINHSLANVNATITKLAAAILDYLSDFADAVVDYVGFSTRKIADCVEGD